MIPSKNDFLEQFGILPELTDEDFVVQYTYSSKNDDKTITFSFNEVMMSFDVSLKVSDSIVASISSECLKSIILFEDNRGKGIDIYFDYVNLSSQATIVLEPDLSLKWWILKN